MKKPYHWDTETFDISSYDFFLKDRRNQIFTGSSSDDSGKCVYTYNEYGFRGNSIHDKGFRVMTLGCSITEGIGLNDNQTWPYLFTEKIMNGIHFNLAMGGRSNDYIARALITFYDLLKPDLVIIMYTESHRREFYTSENGVEPFHATSWGYFKETENGIDEHNAHLTLLNKSNNFYNWYKNHLLISNFLENNNTPFIWDGWYATNDYTDDNRFDGGYYPFIDFAIDGKHPGVKNNKQYSEKLYKYCIEKGYINETKSSNRSRT